MTNEQPRKHLRHKLTDTFIVNQTGVCQIFDLSPGGFSFGCTHERKVPENLTVDIVSNNGMHIWDVSVKTVWMKKNVTSSSSSIHPVRVGAQFQDDLPPALQAALKELIVSQKKDPL